MIKQLGQITREHEEYQVVFHRTLPHPIEKVWEAITSPEQLKYWFTEIEMDFRPGGQITIHFRDKDKTLSFGEIVSIEAPHQFVWTWEGELAIWELKAPGINKTQLTLTYKNLPGDFVVNAPAGFHTLLDRLEDRLEGSSQKWPFGTEEMDPEQIKLQVHYAVAVFRDFPEVIKNQPVLVERVFDAPINTVWQAITDKDHMQQWYFILDEFKPEMGFQFTFSGRGQQGEEYLHLCTITDLMEPNRLQYSWKYKNHPGYSLVTFELFETGNQTRLILSHHGLETFPQDKPDFSRNSFKEGWNEIINNSLKGFLEKNP